MQVAGTANTYCVTEQNTGGKIQNTYCVTEQNTGGKIQNTYCVTEQNKELIKYM